MNRSGPKRKRQEGSGCVAAGGAACESRPRAEKGGRPAPPSLRATARYKVVFHHSEHCLKQVHHAVSNEEHRAKAPVPSDVA